MDMAVFRLWHDLAQNERLGSQNEKKPSSIDGSRFQLDQLFPIDILQ